MTQYRDRTTSGLSESLHVIGELINLNAVDLIPGKGTAQRIDADVLRLDVSGGFMDLPIQLRRFDPPTLAVGRTQRSILAEETKNMKAAVNQFLERDAVVIADCRETDVYFFLIVFGP